MSTKLYLTCEDHNPPLRSECEVGYHLSDLPQVRADIRDRAAFLYDEKAMRYRLPPNLVVTVSPADQVAQDQWRQAAGSFFAEHPHCKIGIVTEYGDRHSALPEPGVGTVVYGDVEAAPKLYVSQTFTRVVCDDPSSARWFGSYDRKLWAWDDILEAREVDE